MSCGSHSQVLWVRSFNMISGSLTTGTFSFHMANFICSMLLLFTFCLKLPGWARQYWHGTVNSLLWVPLLAMRSEEHTSELQSHSDLVCRLLLEKKKQDTRRTMYGGP